MTESTAGTELYGCTAYRPESVILIRGPNEQELRAIERYKAEKKKQMGLIQRAYNSLSDWIERK